MCACVRGEGVDMVLARVSLHVKKALRITGDVCVWVCVYACVYACVSMQGASRGSACGDVWDACTYLLPMTLDVPMNKRNVCVCVCVCVCNCVYLLKVCRELWISGYREEDGL